MEYRYTALVKGPSAVFPRGFLWLVPVWYAGIALLLELKGKTPSWYGDAALGGLLLAACTLLSVLATMRNNAFVADDTAIWLGLRGGATRHLGRRRRRIRYLPWPEIEQVRIFSRYYGARLEILLGEGAPIVRRGHVLGQIIVAGLLMIIPISYFFRTPGLLIARADPPRYRIPVYDVSAADLRVALASLAPATVPVIEIPRWYKTAIGRLRHASRRPARALSATVPGRAPAARPAPRAAVTAPAPVTAPAAAAPPASATVATAPAAATPEPAAAWGAAATLTPAAALTAPATPTPAAAQAAAATPTPAAAAPEPAAAWDAAATLTPAAALTAPPMTAPVTAAPEPAAVQPAPTVCVTVHSPADDEQAARSHMIA